MNKFLSKMFAHIHKQVGKAEFLQEARPRFELGEAASKQLNLNMLGDGDELKDCGWGRSKKPLFQLVCVYYE